jgi:hypothetical protein
LYLICRKNHLPDCHGDGGKEKGDINSPTQANFFSCLDFQRKWVKHRYTSQCTLGLLLATSPHISYLSNKLAQKGHTISFFIPTRTQPKLEHLNLYPDRITSVPITLPHVDGLPSDAETTSDVPSTLYSHLMTAMDLTESHIEHLLRDLKPDIVFYDFAYWVPKLTRKLGIKSINYWVISTATIGYTLVPARQHSGYHSEADFLQPPSGFPVSSIVLQVHETRRFA